MANDPTDLTSGSAAPTAAYPVTVSARLDEPARWLWLVKWFLAIPHLVVLAFLWVAVVLTTIVAGVSIAITGRYPPAIFRFNLGVMQWSWRVEVYAFTLSTDRYPPFALGPDPTYPAQLDIEYPEHLSRGLVWVKWWLLAIPHLIIVGIFLGGAQAGGGLAAVLAVVAGVTLAVKQEYPASVFDLIVGLHRWGWRVVAYVGLMRDEYPPFRLDVGADEPPDSTLALFTPLPRT